MAQSVYATRTPLPVHLLAGSVAAIAQDKNPDNLEEATEMFKLIAEAYATLSDPQKRAAYDAYGKDGVHFEPADAAPDGSSATGGFAGPGWHGHHAHVNMHFADNIFRMFFGGRDPFADFFNMASGGSPFAGRAGGVGAAGGYGSAAYGSGGGYGRGGQAAGGQQLAPMMDPFAGMFGGMFSSMFGGGFGFGAGPLADGAGGFSSYSSSSSSFGGGGTSTSVQSTTTIENGQRVTRTTRTVRHADGRVETSTEEHVEDVGGGGPRVSRIADAGHGAYGMQSYAPAQPPMAAAATAPGYDVSSAAHRATSYSTPQYVGAGGAPAGSHVRGGSYGSSATGGSARRSIPVAGSSSDGRGMPPTAAYGAPPASFAPAPAAAAAPSVRVPAGARPAAASPATNSSSSRSAYSTGGSSGSPSYASAQAYSRARPSP